MTSASVETCACEAANGLACAPLERLKAITAAAERSLNIRSSLVVRRRRRADRRRGDLLAAPGGRDTATTTSSAIAFPPRLQPCTEVAAGSPHAGYALDVHRA